MCSPARIKEAFRKSGLFPINREAIEKAATAEEGDNTSLETHQDSVLCHSCGTAIEIQSINSYTNPMVEKDLIPEALATVTTK